MFSALTRLSLVSRIIIAIVLGGLVATLFPQAAPYASLLGDLFIKALKSVAPILVFVLVLASIANFKVGEGASNLKPILGLYGIGMLLAAFSAVIASVLFPSTLFLAISPETQMQPPGSIAEVMKNLLLSFITNPITALHEANFIGILAWAVGLGVALRHGSDTTRAVITDVSNAVNSIIRIVISFAPLGIFGLVVATFAQAGLETLENYAHLLAVLVATMLFVA